MANTLTLRTNGPSLNTGWFPISAPYSQVDIDSIDDPSSNGETLLLTSIPSPFARFHLFNTAFDMVNASGHAPASPNAYHELVSQSLDLLEICFNFQGIESSLGFQGSSLQITPYDLQQAASNLRAASYAGHRLTGETLETFFVQDGQSANFDLSNPFFLILLGGKVIGSTSPLTVFATCEDLTIPSEVTLNRSDGSPYFTSVRALHERDAAFQLYVHRFVAAFRTLYAKRTPAFYNYVYGSYQNHTSGNPNINGVYVNMYQSTQLQNDYKAVTQGNHALNILGMQFYGQPPMVIDASTSHFIIKPTMNVQGLLPMVLVPGKDQPGRIYAGTVLWDRANAKNAMGFSDDRTINQRTLPGIGHPYPYLTVNDLLQDSIVQMDYENDGSFFANGGYDGRETGRSFLFPVTETFFTYFRPQDLKDICVITDSKLQIDGKEQSVVIVTLSIPTSDGIGQQFTRYYVDKPSTGNTENLGKLVKNNFNLSVFPFYRVTTDAFRKYNDRYRIKFEKPGNDTLTFYGADLQPIPSEQNKKVMTPRHYKYERVSSGQGIRGIDMYAVENSEITLIKASIKDQRDQNVQATGYMLPLFKEIAINSNNDDHFKVAIDFGTTNSHVEMKLMSTNTNLEVPLVLEANENMVGHLGPVQTNAEHFMPDVIGELDRSGILRYSFPTRTVINERPNNQDFETLVGVNILFPYEKEALDMGASSPRTNLKWSMGNNGTASENRVAAFLEQLMLMVRAKIITRGLNPAKTEVTWFYPLSMGSAVKGFLHRKWGEIYTDVFKSSTGSLNGLSESVAPYYYHISEINNLNNSVVLCADIGGGTTDFVFFEKDTPRYAFSALFGGNVLYGTGYVTTLAQNMRNNFVQRHQEAIKDRIDTLPKGDRQSGLKKMFNGMLDGSASSADIVSFFFSNEDDFHYTEMLLADSRSKVVFLLYYGAIIYHAGQVLKQKDLAAPQYICFSGNGSKMLNCIEADINGERPKLDQLTREILKRSGVKDPENFQHIRSATQAKEATCKGALLFNAQQDADPEAIKSIVHLGSDQIERPANITYAQIKSDTDLKNDVVASINRFVDILLKIHEDGTMNFKSDFQGDPSKFNVVREVFQKQTGNFLESGLSSLSRNGVSDQEQVVEPLFFYPFIGALYEINQKI